MTKPTSIRIETAKRLTVSQELALARLAYDAAPASTQARDQLAHLLVHNDMFAEVIALLGETSDPTFEATMFLVQALLAGETAEKDEQGRGAADRALGLARSDGQRAAALADRGKAERRLGLAEARETFARALRFDPHNKNAFKRISADYLDAGEPQALLALIDTFLAQGVAHSRLLGARTLAFARCGEIDQARRNVAMDDFLHRAAIATPPGWDSLDAFNAALAEQLLAHPGLRYERYGTASAQTWRIDAPSSRATPLVGVLLDQIRASIAGHIEAVAHHDHPWVRTRPDAGTLHCWCVITESTGYETWHVHQFGWLSGVYYVQIPDAIARGSDEGGCIAWGLPDDLAGSDAAAAYGLTVARPATGTLMLFPSHSYHRTFPHGSAERRICLAFDIWPD